MGAFIRFLISTPLAALMTLVIFLALYNQLSPKPFLYATEEDDGKIYLANRVICDCGLPQPIIDIFVPSLPSTDNPWSNSEKAVKEPPGQTPAIPSLPKPDPAIRRCSQEKSWHHRMSPQFPESCKKKNVEGTVIVEFDISKEGRAQNISIVKSPDRCFNQTAIKFVKESRFPKYCTPNGKPAVKTGEIETLTFKLAD